MKFINDFSNGVLDFISPNQCFVCDEIIENQSTNKYICPKCLQNLPIAAESDLIINRMFNQFDADDISITEAFSLFSLKNNETSDSNNSNEFSQKMKIHNGFMNIIHNLKYSDLYQIGYEFGLMLGEKIKDKSPVKYDLIIPVPIHIAKKRERGYNQSFYIAKGVNEIINSEINEEIIIRSRYTQTQTKLKAAERKSNIQNVYKINNDSSILIGKTIIDKTILIVDDVFTTGSTINFLAQELLENGAKRIDCGTLALA